ncbi:MAG: hypothetical protein KAT00_02850 [Planctomycetes bacterium]|nr:hypothetical protein [Planctomycetota bacterium]
MMSEREKEIDASVDNHCSALSLHERAVFKSFLLENESLMKELATL